MHVHEDQLWMPFLPGLDGCGAVNRALHGKTNRNQQLDQPVPVLKLIVDDENSESFRSSTYAKNAAGRNSPYIYAGDAQFDRDLEPKYGTPARPAGNCDIAPHQPRVLPANGESEAGSLQDVLASLGLSKRLEQLLLFILCNTQTGVLY